MMKTAGALAVVLVSATLVATAAFAQPAATPPPTGGDRYRDGIVIWETPADAQVPFLLNFNINTQLRYLNTQSSDEEFTDHLDVVRDVHTRNDITVNRAMFILGGYASIEGCATALPSGRPLARPRSSSPRTSAGDSIRRLRSPQGTQEFRAVDRW